MTEVHFCDFPKLYSPATGIMWVDSWAITPSTISIVSPRSLWLKHSHDGSPNHVVPASVTITTGGEDDTLVYLYRFVRKKRQGKVVGVRLTIFFCEFLLIPFFSSKYPFVNGFYVETGDKMSERRIYRGVKEKLFIYFLNANKLCA